MPVILDHKKSSHSAFNFSFAKMAAGGLAFAATAYMWEKKKTLIPPSFMSF